MSLLLMGHEQVAWPKARHTEGRHGYWGGFETNFEFFFLLEGIEKKTFLIDSFCS